MKKLHSDECIERRCDCEGRVCVMKGAERSRSLDKMRAHDIEISEPTQPLALLQRQKAATAATTNKLAATRTKRELSDARGREGERERGREGGVKEGEGGGALRKSTKP